ncbi:hypothetical protein FGB62_33g1107 [Gracilaria domingensis]|nr:hypothetical protein FGB62_33g1107 [Gracilaria domingensis]
MKWLASFVSVFAAAMLLAHRSAAAAILDTTQRQDSSDSCQTIHTSMKEAYYSQVDMVRRGLPVRVAQSEYVYAANYYAWQSSRFRYDNLNSTCVWTGLWYGLFDYQNRAKWVIHYLQQIRLANLEINFLNFTQYPSLPDMNSTNTDYVDALWQSVDQRLKSTPRGGYVFDDFMFPSNVEVLYDPGKELACSEYYKFGSLNSTNSLPAPDTFVILGIASIKMFRDGGRKSSIEQMLTHFAGYTYNGVRCTRTEKEVLRIPLTLLHAYSRNLGFIFASCLKNPLVSFSVEAFETVFADEISSLTSYNSWGHTEYAKLVGRYSIPAIVNAVDTLLDQANYEALQSYDSNSTSTSTSSGSSSSSDSEPDDELEYDDRFLVAERSASCGSGYVWLARENPVTSSSEHCCAAVCEVFSLLSTTVDPYPHDECCYRCNENHGCPSGLTDDDIFDNDNTYIIVPEYGDQSQQTVTMVDI